MRPEPSPPPPSWGGRLFRWRSYAPIAVLAGVIVVATLRPEAIGGAPARPIWTGAGILLGLLGLLIRAWGFAGAAPGTSGRATTSMRADTLNRTGAYGRVRHPLYLGNLLLWLGVAAVSGRPEALALTVLGYALVYGPIMAAEDAFLRRRFGDEFDAWAGATPALVPRTLRASSRGGAGAGHAHALLRRALRRDYHAILAFVTSTFVVAFASGGRTGTGWTAWLSGGVVVFTCVHVLKRHTSMLEPETGDVSVAPSPPAR